VWVVGELFRNEGPLVARVSERAVSDSGVEIRGTLHREPVARSVWSRLLSLHPRTGWYPFLTPVLGPAGIVDHDRDDGSWGRGGPELLAQALAREPGAGVEELVRSRYLDSVQEENPEDADYEESLEEVRRFFDADHTAGLLRPDYGTPLPGVSRQAPGPRAERWVNVVRAGGGYELPALFPRLFQTPNWSGYPDDRLLLPGDHVAVLRHWHDKYGAEVHCVGGCLDLMVRRPPLDRRTAARAAVEQYAYCYDIGDPSQLGDGQVRSGMWSFWWD
jgi:hypothetical protein